MGFFSRALKIATPLAVAAGISAGIMTVRDVEYKVLPRDPGASDIFLAFGKNFGKSIAWGFYQTGQFIKGAYEGLWKDEPAPRPEPKYRLNDGSVPRRNSLVAPAIDPVAAVPGASGRPVAGLCGVPGLVHSFRIESGPAPSCTHLLPASISHIVDNRPQTKTPQPLEIT